RLAGAAVVLVPVSGGVADRLERLLAGVFEGLEESLALLDLLGGRTASGDRREREQDREPGEGPARAGHDCVPLRARGGGGRAKAARKKQRPGRARQGAGPGETRSP